MNEVFEKILEELDKQSFYMQTQGMNQEKFICTKKATEIIKKVAEKYNDGWIPCSERLPEEGEDVLVFYEYFRYGNFNCMYKTYGVGCHYKGQWCGGISGDKLRCIAWQPLPEPYQPKGE